MSYRIAQCTTFMSDFVRAPRSIQKKCLKEVIPTLEETPGTQRGKKTKKLKGYTNIWRYALTAPEYRIIYEIDRHNQVVKLLMMGPRKDDAIYKRLHYVPEKGPTNVTMEVAPKVELQCISETPDVRELSPPEPAGAQGEALPELTEEQLNEWRVEPAHWAAILECRTEDELLNADLPQHVTLRVIDCLWPRPIERVVSQPTYLVEEEEDFGKVEDGQLSRLLLNLDKEQRKAIERNRTWPILIKGGPGTGKSVVALYKAASLIKGDQQGLFKPPRILFTTYTNSLINASRELLASNLGKSGNQHIEFRTINGVAAAICRMNDYKLHFADNQEDLIKEVFRELEPEDRKSLPGSADAHYLLEEIEWVIEGWDLKEEQEYLQISRPGRRMALNERQRKIVWALYQKYRGKLKSLNKNTYEEAQGCALRFAKWARSGDNRNAKSWRFDYVFVDEAQDLKPVGLRLCAALCRSETNVYLTADMNQAIYGKGVSWNSVVKSLRFTGRKTTNLTKNYRSTDQILRGADDLARDLEDIDSETVYTEPVYTGPKPEFRRFQSADDRAAAMAKWIETTLRALRLPFGCAAVLCNTRKAVNEFTKTLNSQGLPSIKYCDGGTLDTPKVKIMPIHGAKGLEFPVVAIPDFRSMAFSWLVPGAPEAQVVAARKLYFVACTRAMKRLLVCVVGNQKDPLHRLINTENWEA